MTVNVKPFVVGAVIVGAILVVRHYMRKVKPLPAPGGNTLTMDDASVAVR